MENNLEQNSINQNQKQENKNWLKILIIILVAIALVVVIYFIFINNRQDNNQKNEPEKTEQVVRAGEIKLKSDKNDFVVGDEVLVDILLNTQDSNIVLVTTDINFDNNILELMETDTQNSVLSMSIIKNEKENSLQIIRGAVGDTDFNDTDDGFTGIDGNFASLKFKTLKTGTTEIKFDSAKSSMLLDDGKGTEMEVNYKNLVLNIN